MTAPGERAAKAIAKSFGSEDGENWDVFKCQFEDAAESALAAIAEPSEAMIEAIKSAWKTAHVSISDSGAVKIWKAAHAAMMAEKDAGE